MNNTRVSLLEHYFNSSYVRICFIIALFSFILLPSDFMFFILIALNIPHFALSSYHRVKSTTRNQDSNLTQEVTLLLITIAIAIKFPQIIIYGAISRFLFHFFEDSFFNQNFHSYLLNTLLLSLFLVDNFPVISSQIKIYLLVLTGALLIYNMIDKKLNSFLNFYIVFYLVALMPTLFALNINNTAWFSFGTLHSLLWLFWEGVNSKNTIPKVSILSVIKSNSFLISIGFTLICFISLLHPQIDYSWYRQHLYMFFNIILFQHVFSSDFTRLTKKLFSYSQKL